MKALKEDEITMQYNPNMKYVNVISDFSSSTATAFSADCNPSFPLRNLPGPKTEHVAEFKIAHSSSPIADAVMAK